MLKPALLEPVIFELMPLEPVSRPFYFETSLPLKRKQRARTFGLESSSGSSIRTYSRKIARMPFRRKKSKSRMGLSINSPSSSTMGLQAIRNQLMHSEPWEKKSFFQKELFGLFWPLRLFLNFLLYLAVAVTANSICEITRWAWSQYCPPTKL